MYKVTVVNIAQMECEINRYSRLGYRLIKIVPIPRSCLDEFLVVMYKNV